MDFPFFAAKLALTDKALFERLVQQADVASGNALDTLQDQHRPRWTAVFVNGVWVHRDHRYWFNSAGPFASHKAAVAALPGGWR